MPLWGQKKPFHYEETFDQAPVSVSQKHRLTTPAYEYTGVGFSVRQVNIDGAGRNIVGDAANEPSLVIDPMQPTRMAIGWRQFDTIASNFRQAGVAFSFDAGTVWRNQRPIEAGIFRSDPVLDADRAGNFYYNSLTNSAGTYSCHVFKSEAGGSAWGPRVFAWGGDKQWMAIDRTTTPTKGNIYAFWKSGISSCPDKGFTRSLNGGATYEPCEVLPLSPERGTLVVSPTGSLYACGSNSNGFAVIKSEQPGAPVFSWNNVQQVDLGGNLALYDGPNPTGMLGQSWIDVDNSGTSSQGNVYLLSTVTDDTDPANIMLARSTDGGGTWEPPVRINDDTENSNWQWFGSLSVAPTGRIDVTWFDTRDNPGTYLSRLYYSYSQDGGRTWSVNKALSEAFDPHLGWPQQTKIGDYNHQRSDARGVHLAWAATFNGEQDVFYSYLVPDAPTATSEAPRPARLTVVPNPFSGSTRFYVNRQQPGHVEISISDAMGNQIEILDAGHASSGVQTLEWQTSRPTGVYFYKVLHNQAVTAAGRLMCIKE